MEGSKATEAEDSACTEPEVSVQQEIADAAANEENVVSKDKNWDNFLGDDDDDNVISGGVFVIEDNHDDGNNNVEINGETRNNDGDVMVEESQRGEIEDEKNAVFESDDWILPCEQGAKQDLVEEETSATKSEVTKSLRPVDDFFKVQEQEGGVEEGEGIDDEDSQDNKVTKSIGLKDDHSGIRERDKKNGESADKMADDDVNENNSDEEEESTSDEDDEDNEVMKTHGQKDDSSGIQEDGEAKGKIADDEITDSFTNMNNFSRVQEVGDEEGQITDDVEDKEDYGVVKSPVHIDKYARVQEDSEKEGGSTDDLQDSEDNKDIEEEDEVPSLISPGRQKRVEILVDTVYVKGLTKSWNVEKLKENCKKYGEIKKVKLAWKFGAARKDFGFITFTSTESASACVEGINNAQFGGETKVRAELAKPKLRGQLKGRNRGLKSHTKRKDATEWTEIKGKTSSNKSRRIGNMEKEFAKERSQVPSESKSTKRGKSNKCQSISRKGQDADPGKTGGKRKNMQPKVDDCGKKDMERSHNKSRANKYQENARGRQSNREKKYRIREGRVGYAECTSSYPSRLHGAFSGSRRRHLDMEPHAGYIEPPVKKQAQHRAGYLYSAHRHQQQSHASDLQPGSRNEVHLPARYLEPSLGRHALPHAGYLEASTRKQEFPAYDYSLRRTGVYGSQGSQGSAYVGGSAVPPAYVQAHSYTTYAGYQGDASVSGYHNNNGFYLPPPRKHH